MLPMLLSMLMGLVGAMGGWHMRQLRALVVIAALVFAGQAAAKSSGAPSTYKVKRGDTLSTIARKHKTTVDALVVANALPSANKIREGQVLKLAAPQTAAKKPANKTPLSDEIVLISAHGTSTYKVVKGDNLAKVAKRFGTTSAELKRLNGLKKSTIRVGQILTVPGGTWTCPVQGRRDFTDSYRAPRSGGRVHAGTDIFAFRGSPVVAPVDGRIRHSNGKIAGLAFYLYGDDGVTYYGAHLDSLTAKPGRIKAGAQIGTVGDTGNAKGTTPHLHFEIHRGGHAVNPYTTLRRWC